MLDAFRGMKDRYTARNDYSGAKPSRTRRQRINLGGTADAHYRSEAEFHRLREYARDMIRNDPMVGALIDRAVTNLIQTGFRIVPDTDDQDLNKALLEDFSEWAGDPRQCDHDWERSFWQMCWYAMHQTFVDGDMFALLLDGNRIQLIEADRCQSPQRTRMDVVHGVLLDGRRKTQFWFVKDPGQQRARLVGDLQKVDVYDDEGCPVALQIYNSYTVRRITQTRGVTAFAPLIDRMSMYDDVQFAQLVKQQIVSAIALFIERSADYQGGGAFAGKLQGAGQSQFVDDVNTSEIEQWAAGSVLRGAKGEKGTILQTGVPNPEFFPHIKLILQEIGVALGLPLVMTLMDASETNFSGYRGALNEARMGFRVNQKWFAEQFVRPTWKWWVRNWLETKRGRDAIKGKQVDERKLFHHHIRWPRWPYTEPLKEAMADSHRLDNLLASPGQVTSEKGGEWNEMIEETVGNWSFAILKALEAAAKIKEQFPDSNVHWREVLSFGVSDSMKGQLVEQETARELAELDDDDDDDPAGGAGGSGGNSGAGGQRARLNGSIH
jgi:capsid protein